MAAARTAQTRAEAPATVQQLRTELTELRQQHRTELDTLGAKRRDQLADLRTLARTAEARAEEHRVRAARVEAVLAEQSQCVMGRGTPKPASST